MSATVTKPAHNFQIGDILYSSWGYDQTNVDFYQVVKVTPSTIGIRKIDSDLKATGFMCGHVTAKPGQFVSDEVMVKRPDRNGYIKISSYASANKWDGKPKYQSWYA